MDMKTFKRIIKSHHSFMVAIDKAGGSLGYKELETISAMELMKTICLNGIEFKFYKDEE